jgi:hypothetical protein
MHGQVQKSKELAGWSSKQLHECISFPLFLLLSCFYLIHANKRRNLAGCMVEAESGNKTTAAENSLVILN